MPRARKRKRVKTNSAAAYVIPKATISGNPDADDDSSSIIKEFLNSVPFDPNKRPTPLNLYVASRIGYFLALGRPKAQAYNDCVKEYKEMASKQKVQWISEALKQQPVYMVICIVYTGVLLLNLSFNRHI